MEWWQNVHFSSKMFQKFLMLCFVPPFLLLFATHPYNSNGTSLLMALLAFSWIILLFSSLLIFKKYRLLSTVFYYSKISELVSEIRSELFNEFIDYRLDLRDYCPLSLKRKTDVDSLWEILKTFCVYTGGGIWLKKTFTETLKKYSECSLYYHLH